MVLSAIIIMVVLGGNKRKRIKREDISGSSRVIFSMENEKRSGGTYSSIKRAQKKSRQREMAAKTAVTAAMAWPQRANLRTFPFGRSWNGRKRP